jgi:CubicO group peptidase (beta-lactamase class C family)
MRRRLLELCLLAYPRARRKEDRDYLRDLALDLSDAYGLRRQAVSLLRGGLMARIEARRRRPESGPGAWIKRVAGACLMLTLLALAAGGLIGPAAGGEVRVEVDRFTCLYSDRPPSDVNPARLDRARPCAHERRLVAARVRAGWDCATRRRTLDGRRAVAWRCALGQVPVDLTRPDQSIGQFLADTLPTAASGTLVAARGGERIYCEGFGMANRKARIPASCDTVYDIMSMTKQFTAAAILKLQMMGKLEVTDPIGTYIGPVPADKREITLQQLLTHTSGLIDALGGDYDPLSRREMVAGALESKLQSAPGDEYHYSNVGYSLLAAIIEKASGMDYEEFLAKHLFAPSGMTQTGYVLPKWSRDNVAVEYDSLGKPHGRPFDHAWATDGPFWNLRGNGGLLSTARDMLRWHRALNGDEVLDQRSKDELFKPRVLEEEGGDSYYGYGWVLQDTDDGPVAWHNGGNDWSYGELARLLDQGVLVFWVTNRYKDKDEGWNLSRLGPKLTQGVAARVLDGD